ncbi:hypothetical protein KSS87_023244, partial [Heliosperma pusillum]
MQQWVMKQRILIVHKRSYNELQCEQWVMKQGRLIVHTTSYNVTMGNEARKTHCS